MDKTKKNTQDSNKAIEVADKYFMKKDYKNAFQYYLEAIFFQPESFIKFYKQFKNFITEDEIFNQIKSLYNNQFFTNESNLKKLQSFLQAIEKYAIDNLFDLSSDDIIKLKKLKSLLPFTFCVNVPFTINGKKNLVPSILSTPCNTISEWIDHLTTNHSQSQTLDHANIEHLLGNAAIEQLKY